MMAFLSDPALSKSPNGFVSAMVLGALAQFRLQIPVINLLSKCDILPDEEMDRMLDWYNTPDALYGDLLDEDSNPETVIGMELFKAMENVGILGEIRPVSARISMGMEDIYSLSQQIFFAGEDNDREI